MSGGQPPCEEDQVVQRNPVKTSPLIQLQAEEEEDELQTKPVTGAVEPRLQRQIGEEGEGEARAKSLSGSIGPLLMRRVDEEDEEEISQMKGPSGQTRDGGPSPELRISIPGGGGQPLPQSVRTFFEPRFGRDFSRVRVHKDTQAAESAQAADARAFTTGQDVVFGAGQYAPATSEGGRLLAHELTHVVQQTDWGREFSNRILQRTGAEAAQAATSFPSNVAFGRMQQGRGILANPRYWTVEYILQNPRLRRQLFVSSATSPAVWPRVRRFLQGNPRWQNRDTSLFVAIRIGSHGASAAINDLWNPRSAGSYAFECYTAASLVELRGIYLTYRQTNRTEADFDRDYNSFAILHTPQGGLTNLEPSVMETLPDRGIPMNTTEYQRRLRQGDWVYIRNPNIRGAWAGENAVYLGGDQFFGHGLGIFTPQTYAARLLRRVRQSSERPSPMPTQADILRTSQIVPYGRPRQ
jgi:hypothetical protein